MAARASRTENQDAIDTAIVGTLADPKEVSFKCQAARPFLSRCLFSHPTLNIVLFCCLPFNRKARAGIQEVHFLPFNPTDKRTALTYIDSEGRMHRVSKGAPEQASLLIFVQFFLLST